MTSLRMLPAMDIHQSNDEHVIRYYLSKNRYPTDESNDQFELFICPYLSDHKITSKRWRIHLQKCKENYGGNTRPCAFNASHHVPDPEYEWHTMTCPDRNILRRDFEKREWVLASSVNHNPDWIEPDTGETWDDEIDENVEEFTLDVKKGMPLALKPQEVKQEINNDDGDYDDGEHAEYNGEHIASVRNQDLIPEKPTNWNELSKTQKKNHKRKFDRQRQRMAEEGVTEEDFAPEKDPMLWTEKRRQEKLNVIKTNFPMADDKVNASRFDYTSLLNVVCQKVRINLPEYQPCGSEHGGFAYRCRVHQTWYQGKEFASTKKDAKHECAKWALLSMDIPGTSSDAPMKRSMPIHPKLLNQSAKNRESDEVGRLMEAGMYHPQKKAPTLRQPNLNLGGSRSPQRNSPRENSPDVCPQENSMANYVQSLQQAEQQQQQEQQQPKVNSMEEYIRRQEEEEEMMRLMQQQQPQYNESERGQAPRAWEQKPSQPQQTQQIRPAHHQPPQQVRPQQPQKVWGGWGPPQQQPVNPPRSQMPPPPGLGGPPPGMHDIQKSMNAVSLDSGMDFPSLGSDEWKTVTKKSAGVNTSKGRGRGRGRGTTMMKL